MKCDELKLFLYTEGQCPEGEKHEIEEHLSHCKRCRTQLERMKFTTDCFTMYYKNGERVACPPSDEIVRFQEGEITRDRSLEIKKHIAQCPLCKKELQMLKTCDSQEESAIESSISPPPLSPDVLKHLAKLKQNSIRHRMEHVLKLLVEKGKGVLTPDKVTEFLDRHFTLYPEPLPLHALPESTAQFDTELTLRESALCDISMSIGKYSISLQLIDDTFTIRAMCEGAGVRDVEISVMAKELGAKTAKTGLDGICEITGIGQGPYHISIRVPDENE